MIGVAVVSAKGNDDGRTNAQASPSRISSVYRLMAALLLVVLLIVHWVGTR